eukprot:CAMPEP_0113943214 /NCGR_PEP_ID=MMETSP1339-20121228/20815_1 /TAXON_ID=94617 /ORGANISM="Fibrocapsa japonica" /LENGTH=470 /DNA_ID=CAMNT_0000948021 /DNA_START=125 /DNA_END=1537 /DNA_ORIENTATION=+ /assembly_acc=CAM_ASM_000762
MDHILHAANSTLLDFTHRQLNVVDDPVFGSTWQIALASFLCVILGALATSAGIGGGGLFVPLYAYVLGAGVSRAVPLSKATIFGGSLGKYLGTAYTRHPDADRPIVNYDLAVGMQTWELLGTIFGVFLYILLPEILIVLILFTVLMISGRTALKKARANYAKETAKMEAKKKKIEMSKIENGSQDQADGSAAPATGGPTEFAGEEKVSEEDRPSEMPAASAADLTPVHAKDDIAIEARKKYEAKTFPTWQLVALAIMTIFLIIYVLVKQGIVEGLDKCSGGWWAWYFLPVPFFCLLGGWVTKKLYSEWQVKAKMGWEYLDNDLRWNAETVRKLPAVGFLAGVCASLVGIGGGMITGPLFLQLGIQPQVGSSTSAFMIIFTGLSSTIQYMAKGELPIDFACWLGFLGFLGAQLGHHVVKKLLEKTGRPSYIAFLLAGFVLVSAFVMVITGLIKIATTDADKLFTFDTDFCS